MSKFHHLGWLGVVPAVAVGFNARAGAVVDGVKGGAAVRTHDGVRRFVIDQPWALTSDASLVNKRTRDKFGVAAPSTDGFVLTNRVIVRADDRAAMRQLERAGLGYVVSPAVDTPGFFIISSASVDDAIWAANFLANDALLDEVYLDISIPKTLRAVPSDPSFANQWYLRNNLVTIADSNVEPVWTAGYTGAGVVVGVVEGGWETTHQDLAANFNATASQAGAFTSSHGTGVAGIIAMVANNGTGGAGTAYGAQISRIFFGASVDNADAFNYRNDLNDIKNCSWGPADNGTLHTFSSIELAALQSSVTTGRGGLGEIFVWAAGNGGTGDRVEYDPYASSRFTTPMGGIGDLDTRSSFNELGSAHLVMAHTAGNNRSVYTTTLSNGYTSSFGGSSAASPHGAGVIALMLHANPNLTWRDVQHILINSARKNDPANPGWSTNGAGHDISYDYGYGAVEADAAVNLALTWTTVGPEVSATIVKVVNLAIPDNDPAGVTQTADMTENIKIESVELIMNAATTYVGDLRIILTSPMGTESELTVPRADSQQDLVAYRFTSRRHYDEQSAGTWTVKVSDEAAADLVTWQDFSINVFGTAISVAGCSEADVTTQGAGVGEPGYGVPDDQITGADIQYYVNFWIIGDLVVADVTTQGAGIGDPGFGVPDGQVTGADIQYYVNIWLLGCP